MNFNNVYIGIDGGLDGGISVLNEWGEIMFLWKTPVLNGKKKEYDIKEIVKLLSMLNDKHHHTINAYLEQPLIHPVCGKKSIASTHYCFGLFQGILSALEIPYVVIRAKDWQKEVLKGFNQADTKQASILFCQRKFPNSDFRASTRTVKVNDGLTDATCIAYYCFLQCRNQ